MPAVIVATGQRVWRPVVTSRPVTDRTPSSPATPAANTGACPRVMRYVTSSTPMTASAPVCVRKAATSSQNGRSRRAVATISRRAAWGGADRLRSASPCRGTAVSA